MVFGTRNPTYWLLASLGKSSNLALHLIGHFLEAEGDFDVYLMEKGAYNPDFQHLLPPEGRERATLCRWTPQVC